MAQAMYQYPMHDRAKCYLLKLVVGLQDFKLDGGMLCLCVGERTAESPVVLSNLFSNGNVKQNVNTVESTKSVQWLLVDSQFGTGLPVPALP